MERIVRPLKYALNTGVNVVKLPADAKIISVALQDGMPHIWALVPMGAEDVERTFIVIVTGMPVSAALCHIGSMHGTSVKGSPLVLHVFEDVQALGTPVA